MNTEIPIADVERLINRKLNSWEEWLECMGLKEHMFSKKQLDSINKACKKINKKLGSENNA